MSFHNCVLLVLLCCEQQQNFTGENHISEILSIESVRKHGEVWFKRKPEEQEV